MPAPVSMSEGGAAVPLAPADVARLDAEVAGFVEAVTSLDPAGAELGARVATIAALGNVEVAQSAAIASRMLDRPVHALKNGVLDEKSPLSRNLSDLRATIERLDPSRQGDLFAPRKLLGLLPMGNRLAAYFDGYRSAQSHLDAIMAALSRSKAELQKNNADIEAERSRLAELMKRLEQYVYLGKKLDAALSAKVDILDASEPERAKVARDVLFDARQKVTDLLTQMAVNVQGYLALDLLRKNNVELIKGIDRATTTTVSALRTAVIAAQALANQRLVLDQITALNTTTGNLIESTAAMLRRQSAEISARAAEPAIDVARLQRAFDDVYAAMDAVVEAKREAFTSMQQTIGVLTSEVGKAQSRL